MDLAGSVVPENVDSEEAHDKEQETPASLEARPDLKIRLCKPSGRSILFHCAFPSSADEVQPAGQENSSLRELKLFTNYF